MKRNDSAAAVDRRTEEKVDLRKLKDPGTYLSMYEKVVLELAREFQYSKDPDAVSTSWPCQEEAQKFFNKHGFEATLSLRLDLERLRRGKDRTTSSGEE